MNRPHYRFVAIGTPSPLANRASKARLNAEPAPALSMTIKWLSCRFNPEAEKVRDAGAQQSPVDLVALGVHRWGGFVLGPNLDTRHFGKVSKDLHRLTPSKLSASR